MADEDFLNLGKNFIESMILELRCHKCKSLPNPVGIRKNRYNCLKNGHVLCEICKSACLCGSKAGKIPNEFAGKFLESIKNYNTCPYSKFGCSQFNFVKEKHLKNCTFRLANCPQNGCGEKKIFKNLMDHVEKSHPKVLRLKEKSEGKFEAIFAPNGEKLRKNWSMKLTKLELNNGEIFFLTGCVKKNILNLWIYHYGPYDENENYKFTIKTDPKASNVLQFSGLCLNLDKDGDTIMKKFGIFGIGNDQIQRLKNNDGKLKFEITIECLKKNLYPSLYDVTD